VFHVLTLHFSCSFARSCLFYFSVCSDAEDEPDQWSRRHVPLDFHHATFPLSLQAKCTSVLAARQAKVLAAQAELIAAEKAKKRKKRKANANAGPKISASFSVAASSSNAAAAPASSSAAPASLSSFVQRMVRTPAARNNYSGLANTLKLMRSQAPTAAHAAAAPAAAATAASASSRGAAASSSKGGRQVPQAAVVPPAAAATMPSTAAAAVARLPLNSHIGNPDTFHPQVTKEFVAQLNKVANHPSLKRQKINPAF